MASKITTISLSTKDYQDGGEAMTSRHRVKIYFQDDALRERSQANSQQLLTPASGPDGDNDNSAFMAKKALKYRKVFERMSGVDVNSPGFDASKFLGVEWCKTICLKTYCEDPQ
ncbi:hypothetical protein Poli38472_010386 [Pythium oligandrum]|uniref:Uncharacterized protein n=1 Tax=Pythium oligandrum TaxID=41045 RepID=A0A8K1C326_PYTOL|nr:hypothetical protein Poli38472_010386 [Pythium oligandrum]|eukprot:TMW55504.1 hypothetical protein Poli38472_010386 [Pythium oligandrum]